MGDMNQWQLLMIWRRLGEYIISIGLFILDNIQLVINPAIENKIET